MLGLNEFSDGFYRGLNDTIYLSFDEAIQKKIEGQYPDYNASSFDSMGYYDGYMYGLSLVSHGMGKGWIKPETLQAEIDKCHTHALNAYNNAQNPNIVK